MRFFTPPVPSDLNLKIAIKRKKLLNASPTLVNTVILIDAFYVTKQGLLFFLGEPIKHAVLH